MAETGSTPGDSPALEDKKEGGDEKKKNGKSKYDPNIPNSTWDVIGIENILGLPKFQKKEVESVTPKKIPFEILNPLVLDTMTLEARERYYAKFLGSCARFASDVARDAKPLEWLVPNFLPQGALLLLAGEPKRGKKSLLAMHIASCIAAPDDVESKFLGLTSVPKSARGEVWYVNLEDGRERIARRLKAFGFLGSAQAAGSRIRVVTSGEEFLGLRAGLFTKEIPAPKLLILDPFVEVAAIDGHFDENDAQEMRAAIALYRDLVHVTGASIIINHHFRKSGDTMRGSSALSGASDGWAFVYRKPTCLRMMITLRDGKDSEIDYDFTFGTDPAGEPTILIEALSEFRDGHTDEEKEGKRRKVTQDGTGDVDDGVSLKTSSVEGAIGTYLLANPGPASRSKLAEKLGINRADIATAVRALIRDGILIESGAGRSAVVQRAEDVPPEPSTPPDPPEPSTPSEQATPADIGAPDTDDVL